MSLNYYKTKNSISNNIGLYKETKNIFCLD